MGNCFVTFQNDHEECFSEDGVLIFARQGTRMTLRALSVSTTISDADLGDPAGQ